MISLPPRWRVLARFALLIGLLVLLVLGFSLVNLTPALDYVDVRMLSGPESGHYHSVAQRLSRSLAARGGRLTVLSSAGSVDNLERLAAASAEEPVEYALVQEGIPVAEDSGLELIARLPGSESVFFLGREASALTRFEQLRGLRLGVGARGSGTDHLARQILGGRGLVDLDLTLSNHGPREQLDLLESGALDLGVFVLHEDAALVREAVLERGLQLAAFEHVDVLARRHDFVSLGEIVAGQLDPLGVVPAGAVPVLRVDTLVVANALATRSATVGLLSLLAREYPTLIAHNQQGYGSLHLSLSADAQQFFVGSGPDWADRHLPWLVDIMPLGNWMYVIMAVSVLFNVMGGLHRFRLWRLDATRDRIQQVVRDLLGPRLTPAEIAGLEPLPQHASDELRARLDRAARELDVLRGRCRRQGRSTLVPMGQEWAYRYHEQRMEEVLTAVRAFRKALDERFPGGQA